MSHATDAALQPHLTVPDRELPAMGVAFSDPAAGPALYGGGQDDEDLPGDGASADSPSPTFAGRCEGAPGGEVRVAVARPEQYVEGEEAAVSGRPYPDGWSALPDSICDGGDQHLDVVIEGSLDTLAAGIRTPCAGA